MGDLTEYNVGYLDSFHSFGRFKSAKSWPNVVKTKSFLEKRQGMLIFSKIFVLGSIAHVHKLELLTPEQMKATHWT